MTDEARKQIEKVREELAELKAISFDEPNDATSDAIYDHVEGIDEMLYTLMADNN